MIVKLIKFRLAPASGAKFTAALDAYRAELKEFADGGPVAEPTVSEHEFARMLAMRGVEDLLAPPVPVPAPSEGLFTLSAEVRGWLRREGTGRTESPAAVAAREALVGMHPATVAAARRRLHAAAADIAAAAKMLAAAEERDRERCPHTADAFESGAA